MISTATEAEYRRSGYITYSPSGHIYQLSHAVQACKNSPGVIALKLSSSKWLLLRKTKENLTPTDYSFFNGCFFYYLGHKVVVPLISNYLKTALEDRNYLLQSVYEANQLAPGLSTYLTNKIMHYNANAVRNERLASGVTILYLVGSTESEKSFGGIIYPNNKIKTESELYEVLYEGDLTQEQFNNIEPELTSLTHELKELDETELSGSLTQFVNKLKYWSGFLIDLANKTLKRL